MILPPLVFTGMAYTECPSNTTKCDQNNIFDNNLVIPKAGAKHWLLLRTGL